jgi:hypothetical protein
MLGQTLMRTVQIEIVGIRFQHSPQLTFTENQQVIQTFAADTSEEPLAHGVRAWCGDRGFEDVDVGPGSRAVKGSSVLCIMIPNEVLWSGAKRGCLAQLLSHPGFVVFALVSALQLELSGFGRNDGGARANRGS